jgi:putative N6-adenine-specific DNA methylase
MRVFYTCLPGLEPLLARQLGGRGTVTTGGVEVDSIVTPHPSIASHALRRLGSFMCRELPVLDRKARAIDWKTVLGGAENVALAVTASRSRLYHVGAIAQRFQQAHPFVEKAKAENRLLVRFDRDVCELSLELGAPLHQRGYRLEPGKAPLREDLASALLFASGFDGSETLIDPLCGSGTIAIEAARQWPAAQILASDRNDGAVQTARRNAERAGVGDRIVFSSQSFSTALAAVKAERVLVVCNPPFGVRLAESKDLRNLYCGLGNAIRPGWRLAFVCGDKRLAALVNPQLQTLFETRSGGMRVFGFLTQAKQR